MLKALIVDDDLNVFVCLQNLIPWKSLGYDEVAKASNGAEALSVLKELKPNVIITDLKMPIMDGIEFCQKIRSISDETAIIFLSAYESFSAAQIALRCNVMEYILKPINKEKIEQLSDLLQDLSKHYYHQDFFHNILNNKNLTEDLINRIRCRDTTYFNHFFQGFSDCTTSDFTTVQEASLKLVNLIYDYLSEAGMQTDIVEKNRQKTVNELSQLQKKMDKVTYISKLFSDVLQFSYPKIENYHGLIMKKIQKYLQDNMSNPTLGVATVADKFGFSPDYLGKIFIKHLSVTLNTYLLNLRLEKALHLLGCSDVPINDIAAMTGYSSLSYFSRVFKKEYGKTPSEYRLQIQTVNSKYNT